MAELTNLETKLGEVIGLAMAVPVRVRQIAAWRGRPSAGTPKRVMSSTPD